MTGHCASLSFFSTFSLDRQLCLRRETCGSLYFLLLYDGDTTAADVHMYECAKISRGKRSMVETQVSRRLESNVEQL
jgi:hypothetical protein